jgi:hypothetical protein
MEKEKTINLSAMYNDNYISIELPSNLIKTLIELKSEKSKEIEIKKYIEQSKLSFRDELESLEDELVTYKHLMTTAKNKFKEAKETQLNASYSLWEKFEDELPKVREKINKITSEIEPLIKFSENLEKTLGRLQLYNLEKITNAVEKFSNLYGEEKKIFDFIVSNYKSDTQ